MSKYSQAEESRYNNFNLIRLLGAFGVLFFHVYPATGLQNDPLSFTRWLNFGSLSVRVFFVVSGFLLTDSYIRNPDLKSWIIARVLRIWPALIVCTLFCVFILGPVATNDSGYWRSATTYDYLRSALIFETRSLLPGVFAQNPVPVINGSLWTLPYEVSWYALLALACTFFKAARITVTVMFVACAAIILTGNGVQTPILANVLVLFLCELGPFFLAGSLIRLFNIKGHILIDIVMIAWISYAVLISYVDWKPFYAAQIIAIPYLVIRLAYMRFRPFAKMLARHDISYGLYLYAFPMTGLVVQTIGAHNGVFLTTITSLAATLPLALLSWWFVERPALSLRRYLRASGRFGTATSAQPKPAEG